MSGRLGDRRAERQTHRALARRHRTEAYADAEAFVEQGRDVAMRERKAAREPSDEGSQARTEAAPVDAPWQLGGGRDTATAHERMQTVFGDVRTNHGQFGHLVSLRLGVAATKRAATIHTPGGFAFDDLVRVVDQRARGPLVSRLAAA